MMWRAGRLLGPEIAEQSLDRGEGLQVNRALLLLLAVAIAGVIHAPGARAHLNVLTLIALGRSHCQSDSLLPLIQGLMRPYEIPHRRSRGIGGLGIMQLIFPDLTLASAPSPSSQLAPGGEPVVPGRPTIEPSRRTATCRRLVKRALIGPTLFSTFH
jgi:hypothetical protein